MTVYINLGGLLDVISFGKQDENTLDSSVRVVYCEVNMSKLELVIYVI